MLTLECTIWQNLLPLFSDNSPFVLFSQSTVMTVGSHEAELAGERLEVRLLWNGGEEDMFHFHERRYDSVAKQRNIALTSLLLLTPKVAA